MASGFTRSPSAFEVTRPNPVERFVAGVSPNYATGLGAAYLGDSADLLKRVKSDSIQLIFTSPPFALIRKKPYGNVVQEEYVDWFLSFSDELLRILKPEGSLVVDIGGSWKPGAPVRSTYQFELLLALTRKFHFAQDFYWWNSARLPSPAGWVNVKRVRVKDSVDTIWWLSKTKNPKADNRRVLRPYGQGQRRLMEDGVHETTRPSGHEISASFARDNGGAIPSNLLPIANTDSNSQYLRRCREAGQPPHPARFPRQLPEFFIRFLTDRRTDVVLDPFAGSNMTGWVAEREKRRWIAFELDESYLENSRLRWD